MILTKDISVAPLKLHYSFFFSFQISMTESELYVAKDHKSTTLTTHTILTLYIL